MRERDRDRERERDREGERERERDEREADRMTERDRKICTLFYVGTQSTSPITCCLGDPGRPQRGLRSWALPFARSCIKGRSGATAEGLYAYRFI